MNSFLHNLRIRDAKKHAKKIILPEAKDARVLEAARIILKEKIATPVFVCDSADAPKIKALGLACVEMEGKIIDTLQELLLELRSGKSNTKNKLTKEEAHTLARDPLMYGMYLLRIGEGDGLVAGASYTTGDVLRAGLWLVGKAEGIQTVSSSFYMIVPPFRDTDTEEVLTFSDCAVVPQPTAEQLADTAISSADARSRIVGDEPKVALLSYSTKGSGGTSQSITLVREALALIRKRRPNLIIDGEMQADTALIKAISERKSPENVIQGGANVLIFPSLDAANISYKLVSCLSPKTQALGPILQGMKKPMSDLSRGAQTSEIVAIVSIVTSQI
ncbi:MAG: phosphate acetyltransferase [Candidatus Taylorbacteria bacterium CG11_big_fil_rev_8_21_14_0_20_46_11]|uniref:Phosphate acetyltransferase n=1 Tax=Candidatus Taylorbacteria bacterium CG11_big_fil_rev_8_21_14_0_20_46_11 TaxID=1975025 RepID=A0A2H0KD85_9BACT|nr:MAG: phosphate acetyltransferase [Candidatus Taylorbacteria bacterium CG11_big_fil_rev_8_21_14_0_20_46_11]